MPRQQPRELAIGLSLAGPSSASRFSRAAGCEGPHVAVQEAHLVLALVDPGTATGGPRARAEASVALVALDSVE
jgi:hypothetical protein